MTGEVIRTGKAVVLTDASADERTAQPIIRVRGRAGAVHPPGRAGHTLGSLTVANAKRGPALREAAVQLVETFAEQAAVALEYARLQRQLHRLAVLEDRERIAKELQTAPSSPCSRSGWASRARPCWPANDELRASIQHAVEELDRVIRDLRNYIFGLRPGILADRQLDQALQELAEQSSNAPGSSPSPRSTPGRRGAERPGRRRGPAGP